MRCAPRCIAAALLASALLPASALSAATVEVDSQLPLVRVLGDAAVDRINIEQTTSLYIVTREGGGLTSLTCTAVQPLNPATGFSCPRAPQAGLPSILAPATTG